MADIIYSTELNPTAKLRALSLLELAHPENGHVTLEWDELSDLWGCAQGTVRRQLGAIHSAGLIHYSSNGDGCVYITFKHLSRAHARKSAKNSHESARGRAESVLSEANPPTPADDAERAHARKSAKNSHESARGRAESVLSEANPSYVRAGAGLDGWMDLSITTNQIPSIPPAPQTPTTPTATTAPTATAAPVSEPAIAPAAPPTVEQAICLALLLRIRMRADKAQVFAATLPLATVREAVGSWWMQRKAAGGRYDNHPGIVVHWLENYSSPVWPEPPPAWLREPLYLEFRTREEREADDAAAAATQADADAWIDQPMAPLPAVRHPVRSAEPDPEPDTPAAFWQQLCADMRLDQPLGAAPFGGDMRLHSASTLDRLVIIAPARDLDWMRRKMTNQLRRRARVQSGHDVEIEFTTDEAPQ